LDGRIIEVSAQSRSPKIVISGYYGFDNCGDEAVLLSIIHCLGKLAPETRITVLSGNPEKTREVYGVDAANRWNPLIIAKELISCRLLISGGGSLIQDVTSVRSPGYYLGVIRMAQFFRKRVMIYGQGIGPLTIEKNRDATAKAFNRCSAIIIRDPASAELLKDIGVKRDVQVTCDPVLALDEAELVEVTPNREIPDCLVSSPCLLVAVRNWKDDRHIPPIAELLDGQAAKGWNTLLVPAHFPSDMDAIAKLRAKMKIQPQSIDKCLSAREFLSLAASADRVFSMRLHGLICAMAMGTPMLGVSYDPKIDAFMEQAGAEKYCLHFDDFDIAKAQQLLDETPPSMETRRLELKEQAWETARVAIGLLQ